MILDYKYIEQLLEEYFNGETTVEEEKILRTFFCQESIPEHLAQYRDLFIYEQSEPSEDCLGADFDAKMMKMIDVQDTEVSTKVVELPKASKMAHSVLKALHPFFRAAAVVAVVITIGNASQVLFQDSTREQTGVAKTDPTTGKNVADVPTLKVDSLQNDTLRAIND